MWNKENSMPPSRFEKKLILYVNHTLLDISEIVFILE